MKKILFAASEAIPFIKTGGLADVTGSLPKYFDRKKYDVRIILPKYLCMDERFKGQLHFKCHFYVNLSWRKQYAGIFEAKQDGITYYFVDNEFYFAGDKPYNELYQDIEKFAYFSKAVLEALPFLDFCPDIIHCHDWQTGLIPVFLKTLYGDENYYRGIRTVFSIHNLKFQGRWSLPAVMDITGLPEQIFTADKLESYGEANYLKGGIVYADAVTTVSETYAREITTEQGGEGLDGLLRARKNDLYGILNGLDYEEYDPQKDGYIYNHFNEHNFQEGKKLNKARLQKELGLPVKENTMLIGIVSRMTSQKGFDLVANFSAHKHVRSEKDKYSVQALIENNDIKAKKLLDLLTVYPPKHFFCVSTDKAANPVNIMGASKCIMEDMIMAYSSKFKVTTARFANVAFSNGSLPDGWIQRVMKKQPLAAPNDVKRYFVSLEESGQICLLACILGKSGEIFFPKLGEKQMLTFSSICDEYVNTIGCKKKEFRTDEEAKKFAFDMAFDSKDYPVVYFKSDTTGEKAYEEFYVAGEMINMKRFASLGVIEEVKKRSMVEIDTFFNEMESIFANSNFTKEEVVRAIKRFIPNFEHEEKGKNLDQKM